MKVKKVLAFAAIFFSFFTWSNSGFSSTITGGHVSHIATINGVILFRVTGGIETGHAPCNTTSRFSADKDSEHYQAIIKAFELGTQVTMGNVGGLGTCNRWSNSEDLQYLEINK